MANQKLLRILRAGTLGVLTLIIAFSNNTLLAPHSLGSHLLPGPAHPATVLSTSSPLPYVPRTLQTIAVVVQSPLGTDAGVHLALMDLGTAIRRQSLLHLTAPAPDEVSPSEWFLTPSTTLTDASAVNLTNNQAATELHARSARTSALSLPILPNVGVTILAGDEHDPRIAALLHAKHLIMPDLGSEGMKLVVTTYQQQQVVLIYSPTLLGLSYGLFYLAERIGISPGILFNELQFVRRPAMKLRLLYSPPDSAYGAPETALRLGFNAITIQPWPALASYRAYDPAIYDPLRYPQETAWMLQQRDLAQQQITVAKALHLKVISSGDVFSFPRQVRDLYGETITCPRRGGLLPGGPICGEKQRTWELLDASLHEVLTDFPGIDGLMVRTGENYQLGILSGNRPTAGDCSYCSNSLYSFHLRQIILHIYEQVVGIHHKLFIQRAWSTDASGFHSTTSLYRSITAGFPSLPGLVISLKHTRSDFWRYNEVNPNIGSGNVQQMVEFQTAREFEGKGAYPNYLGSIYADGAPEIAPRGGFKYAYEHGVRAVEIWGQSDGRAGPHLKTTLWIAANMYAATHLAWDVTARPDVLAQEWATLNFGPDAAPHLTQLLLLSPYAVLTGLYTGSFGRNTSSGWEANAMWERDDRINPSWAVHQLYLATHRPGAFDEAIAEREASNQIIQDMFAEFNQARPFIRDPIRVAEVESSLIYQQLLFKTLNSYLSGMFYYYRWDEQGRQPPLLHDLAKQELQSTLSNWAMYQQRVAHLPLVASPYIDQGMSQTIQETLASLDTPSPYQLDDQSRPSFRSPQ